MGLHKIERTICEGPQLVFDCPKCGASGAVANTQDILERFLSFHLIPLLRARYTILSCANCGGSFRMDQRVDSLTSLSPEQITHLILTRISILIRLCVVCGLVLSPIPIVGLAFSGIGLAGTARRASGWKTSSLIGLSLSVVCSLVLAFLLWSERPKSQPFPGSRHEFPSQRGMPPPPAGGTQPVGQTGGSFAVGDKVEARWAGSWRAGSVVEMRGLLVRVRFDDAQQPREIMLPADAVRSRK